MPSRFLRRAFPAFTQLTAVLLLALMPATTLSAQETAPFTFKANTRIVILDVVVTDKKGNVVTDLKQSDFTVLEDKQPQAIKSFEPPSAHDMPPSPDGKPIVTSGKDLKKIGNAPVTILVLDDENTQFSDMSFGRNSLEAYLRKQPEVLDQPTALLARSTTKFLLLQDFTQSRAVVLAALKAYFPEYPSDVEDMGTGVSITNPIVGFNRLAKTMQALNQIIEAMRGIPGRKNVIWIGHNAANQCGISTCPPHLGPALQQLTRHMTQVLLESRVTLYFINPANTATTAFDGREPYNPKDPFGGYSINFNYLAPITGGKEFRQGNNVDAKLETAVDDSSAYYTLSYSPSNESNDPAQYRSITIQLANPDLTATTRGGYYADPPNSTNMVNTPGLKEAQREKMLLFEILQSATSPLTYTGLGVTAQKAADENDWRVSVDTSDLSWAPQSAKELKAEVTATAVALDAKNQLIGHTSHELVSSRANGEAAGTVKFEMTFNAPPNTKRIRFIVRDAVSGKIGTADVTM